MNRRNFLTMFGIGAAAAAVPAMATVPRSKNVSRAVGPVLLERVCDGERSKFTPEEWKHLDSTYPNHFRGCGTRFRWYWGCQCFCPECGWQYLYTIEQMRAKQYFVDEQG